MLLNKNARRLLRDEGLLRGTTLLVEIIRPLGITITSDVRQQLADKLFDHCTLPWSSKLPQDWQASWALVKPVLHALCGCRCQGFHPVTLALWQMA